MKGLHAWGVYERTPTDGPIRFGRLKQDKYRLRSHHKTFEAAVAAKPSSAGTRNFVVMRTK